MKKALRYVITAALVFSILLSALYIVMYVGHECSLDDCCICERIEAAFGIIKNVMGAGIALCAAVAFSFFTCDIITTVNKTPFCDITPVRLKVRMND